MTTPPRPAKPKTARAELQRSLGDLIEFSTGLIALAELSPRTLTLGQMTFFLIAAGADLKGKPAVFSEIREAIGDVIGNSLHTTYKVFLDEAGRRTDQASPSARLGWLTRVIDPQDNRRKFLHLTAKGHEVLLDLQAALDEAKRARRYH
jgi:hypothetical protein